MYTETVPAKTRKKSDSIVVVCRKRSETHELAKAIKNLKKIRRSF